MLVHYVVRHSRPASVRVTFVFFYKSLFFCNKRSSKSRRVRGTALVRGIRFQFFPHGVFLVFRIRRCHRESFFCSQLVVVIVPHVCTSCLLLVRGRKKPK